MEFLNFGTPSRLCADRSKIVHAADLRKDIGSSTVAGCNLQLYATPPNMEISLEDFDAIAKERLAILKAVEDVNEGLQRGTENWKNTLRNKLQKINPFFVQSTTGSEEQRLRDLIGHFILRLAFCRTPELTKWFITHEVDLFRFRFALESKAGVSNFLQQNDLDMDPVAVEERDRLADLLSNASAMSVEEVLTTDFWAVDFEDALELVRQRRVYLDHGTAYVPYTELVVIIVGQLRMKMAAAMARSFKHLAVLEEENRILPRLARLTNNAYSGKEYGGKESTGKVSHKDIDQKVQLVVSFPLCMRSMHHRLRQDHHLRHGARRQYGLFLKGIGLSLEEAMIFFREEFTRKIDSDKFDKEYAYNIRHMYGKEGRRMDYPALPCSAIILGPAPAANDCHGCPFKHLDRPILEQRLKACGMSAEQTENMVNLSKSAQYDRACTRFFEYSHKMKDSALGQLITHPNHYFELSQAILSGAKSKEGPVGTHSQQTSTASQRNDEFSDDEMETAD